MAKEAVPMVDIGIRTCTCTLWVIAVALKTLSGANGEVAQHNDWLVGSNTPHRATVSAVQGSNGTTLISLRNGLVQRQFTITADGTGICTTGYKNLVSGRTFFRAVAPESNVTLSTDVGCPQGFSTVTTVSSIHPNDAREQWINLPNISGRIFKFLFQKPSSGFQPMVSEMEFFFQLHIQIDGVWRKNSDTANNTIVTSVSGFQDTPSNGRPWAAFDGNTTSVWDSVNDETGYWLVVDFGIEVTFNGLALVTPISTVPGQGYYWRPNAITVQKASDQDVCSLPYDIGGCLGQPTNQFEFWTPDDWLGLLHSNPAAFQFANYSVSKPAALFPWTPGVRHSPKTIQWPPAGVHLALNFTAPPTAPSVIQNITIVVHYELYDSLPTFRKWVSVHLSAQAPSSVEVSTMNMELLRAPNFAPEHMTVITQQANNPTPFDQQVKPESDQSFPGRDRQLWYFDPNYDQGGDQEIHVTYTYYTFLVAGYGFDTTFFQTGGANSTGPGALLTPGHSFASLSVRTVLHDSSDAERQGLGVRQSIMKLAPQVLENPVIYMITDISGYPEPSTPMRLAVDQAAATGHELVIIGFGAAGYCGLCDKQMLDPAWRSWFKSEVQYANSKGIEVSAYTLMQHNGWGEVTPTAEQALFSSGRGSVACMATDFHAKYRENVLNFINETGMGGLETDGQYEDYSCSDTGGDHHHNGLAGSYSYQLQTTLDFNIALKSLGVYQTGADAYIFSGANKWNHADTDAFGRLPFWPHVTVGRMYIYDSTMNRVPASGQIAVNDLASSSVACGKPGSGERIMCFDYGLASGYALGTIPSFRSSKLWDPNDVDAAKLEAVITKWVNFFKAHRTIFVNGHMIHIRRPDSRDYEAISYVWANAPLNSEFGIVSVFNPTREVRIVNVTMSLYYAGLSPGNTVTVSKLSISSSATTRLWAALSTQNDPVRPVVHTVGQEGGGLYDICIPCILQPTSYAIFSLAYANTTLL